MNTYSGEEPPVSDVSAKVLQAEHLKAAPRVAREGEGTVCYVSTSLYLFFCNPSFQMHTYW